MSPGDCKRIHSFLSPRLAGLVNIKKGLSGAVKRAYCYIPALTTASERGFPFYNNNKQPAI